MSLLTSLTKGVRGLTSAGRRRQPSATASPAMGALVELGLDSRSGRSAGERLLGRLKRLSSLGPIHRGYEGAALLEKQPLSSACLGPRLRQRRDAEVRADDPDDPINCS